MAERPPALPPVRRLAWLALPAALAVAVMVLLLVLVRPEPLAWLLARVPGLEVQGLRGALVDPDLAADRIVWEGSAGRLEITDLRVDGVRWAWHPAPDQWLGLRATRASASSVSWTSSGAAPGPATPPQELRLPLAVHTAFDVGTLSIDKLPPVEDIAGIVDFDATTLAVDRLRLRWQQIRVRDGQVSLASTGAPLDLHARASLASVDDVPMPWQAQLALDGTLAAAELNVSLRSAGAATLDATAQVEPFADWPVRALGARLRDLDLAALVPGAAQTSLSGTLAIEAPRRDAPLQLAVDLVNSQAGRWDEGGLPVRRLVAKAQSTLDDLSRVTIDAFDADLLAGAGRISGQGLWAGDDLTFEARLHEVVPGLLGQRAPAMQLDGPIELKVSGLPSADGSSALAPDWWAELDGRIEGRQQNAPRPVRIAFEARATPDAFELRRIRAATGDAVAEGSASWRREGERRQLRSQGTLHDFDPAAWWPGAFAGVAGAQQLNGRWEAALALPASAVGEPLPKLLASVAGSIELVVEPSIVAGVEVEGRSTVARSASQPATVTGEVQVGANRLRVEGRFDPAGRGRSDSLEAQLQAPDLAAVSALAQLAPQLRPWWPTQGQGQAKVQFAGRWPAVGVESEGRFTDLKAPRWQAELLQWQARGGPALTDPLHLSVTAQDVRIADQALTRLDASVDGSASDHRISVDLVLPLNPPAELRRTLAIGAAGDSGTRLSLRGRGMVSAAADGWRWHSESLQLAAGPADSAPGAEWLTSQGLQAELAFDSDGSLRWLELEPGSLRLARQFALDWTELRYDAASGRLDVEARVAAFPLAPLLARLQPEMGWQGDLELGGSISIHAGETMNADIVFERRSGDLRLRDPIGNERDLGMTDLRLALSAHDGTWYFTQALAGRNLGEAGGALRVQTSPDARWPAPQSPLDGTVQARVADLGAWGAWVPAGWRLQGEVAMTGTFGGTLGAPEVTGQMTGTGIGVRNLLQGIDVSDGNFRVRLEGDRATIERFTLAGGDGTLSVAGTATLASDPALKLAFDAKEFRLLGRVDRQLVLSGHADLELQPDLLRVRGDFSVDRGLYDLGRNDAPSLDDDVVIRGQGDGEDDAAAGEKARKRGRVDVLVGVDLGSALRVHGRGLDTRLQGKLELRAAGRGPRVFGTVHAAGGTYAAYGQKLDIVRGLITFTGPVQDPRLDVLAVRPDLDVVVGVAITGTAQSPRVQLYSEPPMSDTDKLSWLVLGREPSGLGRADTALLQRAAIALLAGEGDSSGSVLQALGLDNLSVRQSDGEVQDTIVSLGKQLSRRWYLGYERGVNATVGTWQLVYRIARRFTLRVQSGDDNSIDLLWTWRVR